jgi:hypothetical protein
VRAGRPVRVLHDHARTAEVERGPGELLEAVGVEDHREVVVALHHVGFAGVGEGAELHGVGVRAVGLAAHLDPEGEGVWIGLAGADLEHLLPGLIGDGEEGFDDVAHVTMIRT